MNRRLIRRAWSGVLFAVIVASAGNAAIAQSAPPSPAVVEVRHTLTAARTEIDAYKAAGGAAGAADHPAIKWDAELWAYRDRYPRSDAAAMATSEAVRFLVRAELWDRARARIASVAFDDPAWERLPSPIYDEGILRKNFEYTIATLSQAAAATMTASIKAAALVTLGRVHRRQGDLPAATRALDAARDAAPGTRFAEEADGLIYEIVHLSVGLTAPAISAKPRNARRAIALDSFRGKPVVLVFWGTT